MRCLTCRNIVDPGADFCPNCGLKKPLQSGCVGTIGAILFLLVLVGWLFGDKAPPKSTPVPSTAQQPIQPSVQPPIQAKEREANAVPAPPPSFVGLGVAAIDGDTIKVLKGDVAVVVRLSAIAAPEMKQPFGSQAKSKLSSLTFAQTLTVYPTAIDSYGRYTAWVFRGDVRINSEMVRRGMAWRYDRYAKGDTKLLALQRVARDKRIGLWRDTGPVAPWLWSQANKG